MSSNSKPIRSIVTLTTDFGTGSPDVAQMKGVLLSRNPDLEIVDVSHNIPPQDISSGAIVLQDVCARFPPRTIHLAVIDPGVGTERDIVYAKCGEQQYIAPNNGLLTYIAARSRPTIVRAVTNRLYFLPTISATFHGRDIMAPVAAHLSLGLKPARLGPALETLVTLTIAEPVIEAQRIVGSVIQIDTFGNVITNISAEDLAKAKSASEIRVCCRRREIMGLVATYGNQSEGTLVALIGSGGRLELAVVRASAANLLGVQLGDEVIASW
jgi:S-adenosylmethionine hydrolase